MRHAVAGVAVGLLLVSVAGCSSPAATPTTGEVVAASGFQSSANGFPFENYGEVLPDGDDPTNLTAQDLQKMFGNVVCAEIAAGKCTLLPEAEAWLKATNQQMAGGHCFGFSVAAELLWTRQLNVKLLGAPAVGQLQIENNQVLQRLIAYAWALQLVESVRSKIIGGTPNQILDKLKQVLKPSPAETYTIALYKPDGSGGHAVTPVAVRYQGAGKYDVLIYDNNWPGETRAMVFDTTADTWTYVAGTNPSEPQEVYKGDADTQSLYLFPTSPGLGRQPCPFCGKQPTGAPAAGAVGGAAQDEEIYLDGGDTRHAGLLITNSAGGQIGNVGDRLVDDIAGAQTARLISGEDWTDDIEPDFFVPSQAGYTITINGKGLTSPITESLGVVGPSFDLSIDGIVVNPGNVDTLVVQPDATSLSYRSARAESPTIDLAVSDDRADYAFQLRGVSDRSGSTLHLSLPSEGGTLTIDNGGAAATSSVSLEMTRYTAQESQVFRHAGIQLGAAEAAHLEFGNWTSPAEGIPLVTTVDGHTSTEALADQGAASAASPG